MEKKNLNTSHVKVNRESYYAYAVALPVFKYTPC